MNFDLLLLATTDLPNIHHIPGSSVVNVFSNMLNAIARSKINMKSYYAAIK